MNFMPKLFFRKIIRSRPFLQKQVQRRKTRRARKLPRVMGRAPFLKKTFPLNSLRLARKKQPAAGRRPIRKTGSRPRILSTGILRRNPNTTYAVVDIVNLGTAAAKDVSVQVLDWSSGTAVPLNVSPCDLPVCKSALLPRSSDFLYADVSQVEFKYEVRITLPRRCHVLVSVSGVSEAPLTPQVGDNVLQHGLVEIYK